MKVMMVWRARDTALLALVSVLLLLLLWDGVVVVDAVGVGVVVADLTDEESTLSFL